MRRYFIGLDLGQTQDHSAVTVLETNDDSGIIRHLERMPLSTPYPVQIQRLHVIIEQVKRYGQPYTVVVDQSGVGRAVVDMIRQSGLRNLIGITITSGSGVTKKGNEWRVAKKDLIYPLILAYQNGIIKSVRIPESDLLFKELMNFKIKVNERTGNETFENFRDSEHDDLVLSAALAVFVSELGKAPTRQIEKPYTPNPRNLPGQSPGKRSFSGW